MNPIRRGDTPESEAVGSSEDERPWPSSTSFGSLPQKQSGVPGLPGGIWSTSSQRKGSFKLSEAAQRNATREVLLGAPNPHSALRTANTPSPDTSEGAGTLPFAIPLQPTQKVHRSLSHSQGQREAAFQSRENGGGAALPPGLLANLEEVDDADDDSDFGGHITQTVSHPPIGALQRASTYSAAYDHPSGLGNGRFDDFQRALGNLSLEPAPRRSQWESHLGWAGVSNVNESRRHSLAEIPTRRGSFSDEQADLMGYLPSRSHVRSSGAPVLPTSSHGATSSYGEGPRDLQDGNMRYTEDETGNGFNIPAMYKVPFVEIRPEERTDDDIRRQRQYALTCNLGARPKKQLLIVSFKCSRVEVFFLLDNTGLHIREGDIVIVEADRGQDLGTVQHADVTPDQARLYKRKYAEEQYKWLMMFSRNNQPSAVNPNAQLYADQGSSVGGASRNGGGGGGFLANAPATMQGMPRENFNNLKPKAIKRLASAHEIKMLAEKEGNEAKAKRACQQKVAHLHLQMEILDAEWQWDFQKLIFYYYADHYINFKDLITELYRIYKTRIWLSAVNPASFSQHAMGQPPSGIGPGAITPFGGNGNGNGLNTSYTMAYGQDPDPYGAVPPYRVGYETYDPNYPSIPGVPNSFAPGTTASGSSGNSFAPTAAPFQPVTDSNNPAPTVPPGAVAMGAPSDYNYFYDRSSAGIPDERNSRGMSIAESHAGGMAGGSSMGGPPTPQSTHSNNNNNGGNNPYMNPFYPTTNAGGMPFMTTGYPPNMQQQQQQQAMSTGSPAPYSPWNAGHSPINPAAGGLGRQAELPQPIGTQRRATGFGMSGQAQGQNQNQNQNPSANAPPMEAAAEGYMRQYRANPEAAAHEDRARNLRVWAAGGGGRNGGGGGEQQQRNGRGGGGSGGGYADEMSRER